MIGRHPGEARIAPQELAFEGHADTLVGLAEAAIDHGLLHGRAPIVDCAGQAPALQAHRSAFVTLFDGDGALRGCMGSITPYRPLAEEVSANAFAAAFRDPRFPPLRAAERGTLSCKLSVLTVPELMPFTDEADVVARLRPGIDGVVIEGRNCRGTFLPAVWEQLPGRVDFWLALKQKAGLAVGEFPADVQVYRYEAVSLG